MRPIVNGGDSSKRRRQSVNKKSTSDSWQKPSHVPCKLLNAATGPVPSPMPPNCYVAVAATSSSIAVSSTRRKTGYGNTRASAKSPIFSRTSMPIIGNGILQETTAKSRGNYNVSNHVVRKRKAPCFYKASGQELLVNLQQALIQYVRSIDS